MVRQTRRLMKEMEQACVDLVTQDNRVERLLLADNLCRRGILSWTDEMTKMISYLQSMTCDFSWDSPWLPGLLEKTLKSLEQKVDCYLEYGGKPDKMRMGCFVISREKMAGYGAILHEQGFHKEEIEQILSGVVEMINLIKEPEEIKVVFEEFQVLELSMKDWKSFVQENWYMLLGDYTRDIGYILDGMVERYGKEETFRLIKEDPYLLRTWKEE